MPHENVRLIEQWFEIQTSQDLDAISSLFAEDVVYKDFALELTEHGHSGVRGLMESLYKSYPDYKVTIVSAVADDQRGGAEMILSGTDEKKNFGMGGTGRRFSIPASAAMQFKDGKITHWSDYWSVSTFKKQVGTE